MDSEGKDYFYLHKGGVCCKSNTVNVWGCIDFCGQPSELVWCPCRSECTAKCSWCLPCHGFVKLLAWRIWRGELLLVLLYLAGSAASKCVYKNTEIVIFWLPVSWSHLCDTFSQGLQIPWAGTSFVSLPASNNWTLGSGTSDQVYNSNTNSKNIFSISALIYFLHTSHLHDENQLHPFHSIYNSVFLV